MCGDQYGWGQLAIPTVYYSTHTAYTVTA